MNTYEFHLGFLAIGCRARKNRFKSAKCPKCPARFYCWSSISKDDVDYFRNNSGWNRPICKNEFLKSPYEVWKDILKNSF